MSGERILLSLTKNSRLKFYKNWVAYRPQSVLLPVTYNKLITGYFAIRLEYPFGKCFVKCYVRNLNPQGVLIKWHWDT